MPPSPKAAASTSPSTTPATTSRGWRKLPPPNKHSVSWTRISSVRFRVNRAVLPHMRRQRSGVLMHISSGAGRVVLPSAGFYCASKFALEALAEAYSYELAAQGIESVIVEPGAYETPVFGNTVTAADEARTHTYGAVNEIPAKLNAALSSNAGNAQEVADAVLRIVETPTGEKQLRYLVSPEGFGVDQINALSKQVQAKLLEAFGLAADTK